jgi:hypothetical protein
LNTWNGRLRRKPHENIDELLALRDRVQRIGPEE